MKKNIGLKCIDHLLNSKKPYTSLFPFILIIYSQGTYANWETTPNSNIDIPVNITSSYPNPTKKDDNRNQMGQITPSSVTTASEVCDNVPNVGYAKSDGDIYGIVIAPDILLTFSGAGQNSMTTSEIPGNNTNFHASWSAKNGSMSISKGNYPSSSGWIANWRQYNTLSCVIALGYWSARNSIATFNGKITIYVGPTAVKGVYDLPALYWNVINAPKQKIFNGGRLNVISPRNCTVHTDNTITFPAVDITDAVNGRALANKIGNFSIQCDGEQNDSVSVEIQGPQGRDKDTLALTMSDGSNAPAEVRGFIGSNIPLTGECNRSNNGANGVVYFTPNAGLEKIKIKPGNYQYNWVLCSTEKFKTGKATGTAKITLNWD